MEYFLPPIEYGESSKVYPMANSNWGMEAFKVDLLREGITETVKIGVIDTGVDASHPLLSNLKGAKDFTNSPYGPDDRHGHGTHVTGTTSCTDKGIGVATGFPVYHGKGLGDSGSGGPGLIKAMQWCIQQGCEILSCSWGGGSLDPEWEAAFAEMDQQGIWPIFAAGNSGKNTPDTDWPGRSQHLINVAALNPDYSPADFSSRGDKIDTAFSGVNIWSLRPKSLGGGYQQMSGTSMATPGAAGLLALYRAGLKQNNKPIPKVAELRQFLISRSTDTGTPGDDRDSGPGWVTPILLKIALMPDAPPLE